MEKWDSVLNHKKLPSISDRYRKAVTAKVLDVTDSVLKEERQQLQESGTVAGSVSNWDPILISLVRRATPNLIAFDVASVQPMSGPTGLIFAMKSRYSSPAGAEALGLDEPDSAFSGVSAGTDTVLNTSGPGGIADPVFGNTYLKGVGVATATDEGSISAEMAFTIEKATVSAVTRQLKAEYTIELAQDLKAIHGLEAEAELANMLSTEILAEQNRELVQTVNVKAKLGAQQTGMTAKGTFSLATDADGRWSVEKFKGLLIQIEREANVIAKETRRGKGNFIITSSDIAAGLAAAGVLDYAPALSTNLEVDDTGNTFAGMINGRIKVFVDPYAPVDYVTVGYRGTNPYDAGLFYCPYVPLSMLRATDTVTFQPKIAFKTRYGLQQNPFVGLTPGAGTTRANPYFRNFKVTDILT